MNLEAQVAPVSLVPQLDISHHASEDLVPTPVDNAPPALDIETPVDNAPPTLETASPARPGILARFFGSSGTRQQQERHITERRRGFISDTVPSAPSEEQRLLQLQINSETAEQRMVISRMEAEIAELDARKAAAEEALAQSHQRTRALELGTRVNGRSWGLPKPQPAPRAALPSKKPITTDRDRCTPAPFPDAAATGSGRTP